jgi:hypothetical protein
MTKAPDNQEKGGWDPRASGLKVESTFGIDPMPIVGIRGQAGAPAPGARAVSMGVETALFFVVPHF